MIPVGFGLIIMVSEKFYGKGGVTFEKKNICCLSSFLKCGVVHVITTDEKYCELRRFFGGDSNLPSPAIFMAFRAGL